ncbi:MAG: hypothetical protein ABUT20_45805, partial [Bacteroidota bacterium]
CTSSKKKKKLKKTLFFAFVLAAFSVHAQKIDSIFFHLYTDSLKKGVHNYINVDGKLSNGNWLPLTSKEIQFTSSAGKFEGNDLILPANFKEENVTIKAVLKNNSSTAREITIWIKKKPDDEVLPTKDDILNNKPRSRRKSGGF